MRATEPAVFVSLVAKQHDAMLALVFDWIRMRSSSSASTKICSTEQDQTPVNHSVETKFRSDESFAASIIYS